MDAAHPREGATGVVGDLCRGGSGHEMPRLAALVDAVYRFDLEPEDAPERGRTGSERRPRTTPGP